MRTRRAFTLIELLAVLAIIGILLSFIMVAAAGAARDAQKRATEALISKLDSGLGDRLEALLAQRLSINQLPTSPGAVGSSQGAACIAWSSTLPLNPSGAPNPPQSQTAGVLLRYEQIKHEVPDVFVVQTGNSANYPLNFAMAPYGQQPGDLPCVYPIGMGTAGNPPNTGWGIWGVSYTFLTGVYKNLGKYTIPTQGAGFAPAGYNGVDDNGNGFIDELAESGGDPSIATALANHKHVTARAEALYALLVEGQGPYGSVFNRDDFTGNEVKDTDQDGLPEFVDAWGNPLQFYRWPIFYHSDVQRGLQLYPTGATEKNGPNGNAVYGLTDGTNVSAPYGVGPVKNSNLTGALDTREQDPLDPNQMLVSPAWWSVAQNANPLTIPPYAGSTTIGYSNAVSYFQTYFHQLVEPLVSSAGLGTAPAPTQRYWDRSGAGAASVNLTARRAYFTRFLILSAGPDGKTGTPYLTDLRYDVTKNAGMFTESGLKGLSSSAAAAWLQLENQAAQATLNRAPDGYQMPVLTTNGADGDWYTNALQSDGLDDITNHNMNSAAGPVQ